MEFLRAKYPDTPKYILLMCSKNMLQTFRTFCQLFTNSYHFVLTFALSDPKKNLFFTKNFLLKIIIQSSLFCSNLCLFVRTFFCIMEKNSYCGTFFLTICYGKSHQPLVVLNPHCNSSMHFQLVMTIC